MLSPSELKIQAHSREHERKDLVLLLLAAEPLRARSVAELRTIAAAAGIRNARNWNFSSILGSLSGLAIRTQEGWELSESGKVAISKLIGASATPAAAHSLRSVIASVTNPSAQAFVEEAISCVEGRHYRAAVVLSWVGALAVLYDHVMARHLMAFNTEAKHRDAKWKDAKTPDDLSRMKEYDFLQVIEALSVIGKHVKAELEASLKLRNACGHPNSLIIAEHRVASHVETLVLNVFAQFV